MEDIRWKQRFQNFEKAYLFLDRAVAIITPSEVEKAGIVQAFEFTFELAWKTLKNYLEENKVEPKFPRDVIKEAFRYDLIDDGELWMDMLDKRNLLSHTYDDEDAEKAHDLITNHYFAEITKLYQLLKSKL